jgi:hypothetical protein
MKQEKKLTKAEAQAAARIGKRLAERPSLLDMTEGDILDVVAIASDAIGLGDGKFRAFNLKVYKTILEQQPAFAERLVASFRREVLASED